MLSDEIRHLADRSVAALVSSHDYFTFTKRVWRSLEKDIRAGRKFRLRNMTTSTTVNEQTLMNRWLQYETEYLTSSTFQHFVSLFEEFLFDLLRLWLTAYPGSLSKKMVEFGAVLRAADKAAIVMSVVDRELNELKYERVVDWFAYLERLTKLGCPAANEIVKLAEMKASRDILVHNKGIVNATYLEKSGTAARFKDGERLELPEPYHRDSWEMIKKVMGDVSEAVARKIPGND